MKKCIVTAICVMLVLIFCACQVPVAPPAETVPAVITEPSMAPTQPETTTPTEPVTTTPTEPETTQTVHSELYLEEYSVEQVIEYFEEVALDMEYTDGTGNTSLVQKWTEPIYYRIYGDATEEDLAVIDGLFTQLNTIPGFPGIYPPAEGDIHHMALNFMDQQTFQDTFSDFILGESAYGAVQFWYYTATNEIHTANIGYRTDVNQQERNSVLVEEVINGLGITDSVLRPDSVVYQYSNDNTCLSDMDFLILQLLYDPAIECGMDAEACRNAIRQIYY